MATRLNRLAASALDSDDNSTGITASDNSTRLLHNQIRFDLIRVLRHIPLRETVDLTRVLRCLLQAAPSVSQMDGPTFVVMVHLLEDINEHSRQIVSTPVLWSDIRELQLLVMEVTSRLLTAASHNPRMFLSDAHRFQNIKTLLNVLHNVTSLALQDHSLGEVAFLQRTSFLSILASHFTSTSASSISFHNGTFSLPPNMSSVLDSINNNTENAVDLNSRCFQARTMSFNENPFVPSKEVSSVMRVQSGVVSLDMFSCDGQQHLDVDNLQSTNSIEFVVPLENEEAVQWEYQLAMTHMNVHSFNISRQQASLYFTVEVNLAPVSPTSRSFPVTVVISDSSPPHPERSLVRKDFPREAEQLRMFLEPEDLKNLTDQVRGTATFYLGLVETSLNSGRRRKNEVTQRGYSFSAWFGSCRFWNATTLVWEDQGCSVLSSSSISETHCRCNHATAFGSHFDLVPNDLSFADVENFFSLHENQVVITLVCVVFIIYLILLVIARRADLHDLRKGGIVCLSDNNVSDSQLYEVVLDTGLQQTTPMTAKISIILHGELGMSETRELISDDDRPMFDRSSRDRFLITLPDSLGQIKKVQLWHNNAGVSPRWFLTQVLVRDLITSKVQYFLCGKWFAVDKGDGRVERELAALDNTVTFMQILSVKGHEYMADFHAWGSVFTRPAYSHFTRAQRLTCCLTLLLAYMALNAAWYKQQPEQRRGEFGLLDVSVRSLMVGAICCAAIFPLHLFLAFLFRRSRASHSACEHKAEFSNQLTASMMASATHPASTGHYTDTPADAHSTIDLSEPVSATAPQQTMMTYSLLDQSILNWQSIQDWAQRQWVKRQQSAPSSAVSNQNKTIQSSSQPLNTQPVQHTLLAGEDTDQASSGFEDAVSQATAERHRIKPASESTTDSSRPSHMGEEESFGPHICLPSWCRYVAWTLCAVICVLSATITILYGFRFGPVKSVAWLQSLFFSFMICIFFAQPLWIMVTVVWVALKNRNNPAVFDHSYERNQAKEGISVWHRQRQLIEHADDSTELEKGVRARQRSRYLRFSRPPQEKILQESRKKLLKEKNAASFLREMMVFMVMFTLVCVIAYGKDLSSHFLLKQSLHSSVVRGCAGQNFETIHSASDWHLWAQTTLLDAVYGTKIAPPLALTDNTSRGNNILVGHPVLRTYKVQAVPCLASCYLAASEWVCHHPRCFLDSIDKTNNYSAYDQNASNPNYSFPVSGPLSHNNQTTLLSTDPNSTASCVNPTTPVLCYPDYSKDKREEKKGAADNLWRLALLGSTVWGEMAWYDSDGTDIFYLNQSSRENALKHLQLLEKEGWSDPRTRAVVVEMTVLNIPTSLFSSMVLLLELPPSGGAFPIVRIASTWLFRYTTSWDNCVLACELLFILLVLVKVQSELSRMVKKGKRYFFWPWNCLQLLLCVSGLVYIAFYIYRFKLVWDTVEFLRNTFYEQFVSVAFLTAWDELLLSLVGFLVFLVVMTQGLRLLRYCPHLAKFAAVYRRARREIIMLVLLLCVMTGAFCNLGALTFGSVSMSMRSTWRSALTVVALATGIYRPADLEVEGCLWFSAFALLCSTLGFGLLTAYAVAMLTHRVRASKHSDLLVMGKCELLNFCLQQVLLFIGVRKHLPAREPEVHLPPECTLAEFEYQVEELLFRMNALAGTTNLPEKPAGYLTDSDQSQAISDDGISSGGSEAGAEGAERAANDEGDRLNQNVGEDGRLEQRVQKIEDKLYANEPYLAQLLKLDSIGTDILSQEKEKKLRSHLEMEIFRQLQMRRQGTEAMPAEGDSMVDPLVSSIAANYDSASEEGGMLEEDEEEAGGDDEDLGTMQLTSSDDSPGSERALLHFSSDEPDMPYLHIIEKHKGQRKLHKSKTLLIKTRAMPEATVSPDDANAWVQRSHAEPNMDSVRKGHMIPTLDAQQNVNPSRKKTLLGATAVPALDRSDSMRVSGKMKALDGAVGVERCHSLRSNGGYKLHPDLTAIERSDSIRCTSKKSELPPKPTYAVIPAKDTNKRSPKPPPLKMETERVLYRADAGQAGVTQASGGGGGGFWGGSGQLLDSSSGSEQDGLNLSLGNTASGGGSSRRPQGQGRRNLRKTKSRGKGKGAGTLTPTLLLDELSFTVHEPPKDVAVLDDTPLRSLPLGNK